MSVTEMVAATRGFTAIHVLYALPGEDDADSWRLVTGRVVKLRENETAEITQPGDKWLPGHPLVCNFPEFFAPVSEVAA